MLTPSSVRKTGDRVGVTDAVNPTRVFILSTGRTARLRKLMVYNGQAADITLQIGTGATLALFNRRLPRIRCIAGFHNAIPEDECPEFRFEQDIWVIPSAAAAAPNDIEVQVTVDEEG